MLYYTKLTNIFSNKEWRDTQIYYGIGATRPEKSGQTIQVSRSYIVNVK